VAWLLGLVLFAGTAGVLAVAVYPLATGGAALAVLSGSMTPGLPVGGMVFTRPVDPATVTVGDVLTFDRPADPAVLVTHRVIAVDTSGGTPVFTTQGDANDDPDLDPVPAAAVRGELWFSVPTLGRATALLHSPKGLGILVVLTCAAIAVAPSARPDGPSGDGVRCDAGDPDDRDVREWETERLPVVDDATVWLRPVRTGPPPPPAAAARIPVPGRAGTA
jgi:signal peptidase